MTSYITPRLLQAINSFEKRYPEAFETRPVNNHGLEHYIPADDPDMRIRNRFLAQVKAGDQAKKSNRIATQRILDCYNRYLTMSETAKYLGMDCSDVKYITDVNPRLREAYLKNNTTLSRSWYTTVSMAATRSTVISIKRQLSLVLIAQRV